MCFGYVLLFLLYAHKEGSGGPMGPVSDLFAEFPVIAAVKDDFGLVRAMRSDCQVVFLLYGTILNIGQLVKQVHDHGKVCFVHLDLIEGLSNREIAVDAVASLGQPDGIISTKAPLIRRAQQLGMLTVLRMFLLDSMALENIISQKELARPDFIEILPGVIPAILREITEKTSIPLIAGGLVRSKQDVIQALHAGAAAVSTSCFAVWDM